MLPSPHRVLCSTTAVSVSPSTRTITLFDSTTNKQSDLEYEVLVLATGTELSPPGTIPGTGTKREGVAYLKSLQVDLETAKSVAILGGGAIGVREFPNFLSLQDLSLESDVTRFRSYRDGM